jgi:hypothetical protein
LEGKQKKDFMNMIEMLISFMESPIIRYSLYEQIYDKFLIPKEKFIFSVSNYIADINFGSISYNLKNNLIFYLNYLNSGKIEKFDESGNFIGEFYANFINFSLYKNYFKFNVHYESIIKSDLNLSLGVFFSETFKNLNLNLFFDYLGLNTPIIFGINGNYENFSISASYELGYKTIYNIAYKTTISRNLILYISYSNRYSDFNISKDLLTGFLAGIEINFKKYKIGYGIRALSEYGFINTIQIAYE